MSNDEARRLGCKTQLQLFLLSLLGIVPLPSLQHSTFSAANEVNDSLIVDQTHHHR